MSDLVPPAGTDTVRVYLRSDVARFLHDAEQERARLVGLVGDAHRRVAEARDTVGRQVLAVYREQDQLDAEHARALERLRASAREESRRIVDDAEREAATIRELAARLRVGDPVSVVDLDTRRSARQESRPQVG